MKQPIVSEAVIEAIKNDTLGLPDMKKETTDAFLPLVLDLARYDKMIEELMGNIPGIKQKRILEVGAGYGIMLIHACQNYGLDVYGLEPPKQGYEGRYETAKILLQDNGLAPSRIQCGLGEKMPFDDHSFDAVYSFQVLEHVEDPFLVLKESWRVLKPGGFLYCNAPNYNTFFEGHYNIPWIPGLPKWLAKVYIFLLGRDPSYIAHINFLNENQMRKWLREITGFEVRSDFGMSDWLVRMKSLRVSTYTNANTRRLVQLGRRLGIINIVATLGRIFHWQDTFRVCVQKPVDF